MAANVSIYEKQILREVKCTPKEYLPNLLQMVRLFRETIVLQPAEQCLRQGWREFRRGETRPLSELWEGIDAE